MSDTRKSYSEMLATEVDRWQSEANRLAMAGLYPTFVLHYLPATETAMGEVWLIPDLPGHDPGAYQRARGAPPITPDLTRDQVLARLRSGCADLPLYPHAGR